MIMVLILGQVYFTRALQEKYPVEKGQKYIFLTQKVKVGCKEWSERTSKLYDLKTFLNKKRYFTKA